MGEVPCRPGALVCDGSGGENKPEARECLYTKHNPTGPLGAVLGLT